MLNVLHSSWDDESLLTFSCFMCLRYISSLYVRLACTAVWKGRTNFFSATFKLFSVSNATLRTERHDALTSA